MRRAHLAWTVAMLAPSLLIAAPPPRWATAVFPSGREFALEVAADAPSRERGYMFRDRVGPHDGMLFLFDDAERWPFWMKNCRVSLDILWLDEAFRVVWVAANAPPCPASGDCQPLEPPERARYVLEIAAGTAEAEHLRVGQTIVVLSDPPL